MVGQAALKLNTGVNLTPPTHFISENLRAGQYTLDELDLSLPDAINALLDGNVITPAGKLLFRPDPGIGYYSTFEPFHAEGIQNQTRINLLRLNGDAQPLIKNRVALDWELRAALPPYDTVQELMNEYQLGNLRSESASIEFIAFNVAVVDFASKVEGTKAFPRIRLANRLERGNATLGYRVMNRGNLIKRGTLSGDDFAWEDGDGYQTGVAEIDIPVSAALQCFVSFDRVAQHFGWLVDPSTVQNPRRAAYEAFDNELKILKDILEKAVGRGSLTCH